MTVLLLIYMGWIGAPRRYPVRRRVAASNQMPMPNYTPIVQYN